MFRSSRNRDRLGDSADAGVDMAPLIDMVFILLIFFLVTANFQQDGGIEIQRPDASTATTLPTESLRLVIDAEGQVYRNGTPLAMDRLRDEIDRYRSANPEGTVTIAPDARTDAGQLIAVMDEVKIAGIASISVVTRKAPVGRP